MAQKKTRRWAGLIRHNQGKRRHAINVAHFYFVWYDLFVCVAQMEPLSMFPAFMTSSMKDATRGHP